MNTEFFIANRIAKDNSGGSKFTKPIIRISIGGIALGLAVMIITTAVVTGFQNEIRNKVIGFGTHIVVTSYDNNESDEVIPINKKQNFITALKQTEGINHLQVFARKAGIIKANNEIYGVIVKGVGADFNWNFFNQSIVEGSAFTVNDTAKTNSIIISQHIASQLKLKLNDTIPIFFLQNNQQRIRKFNIIGIYKTGMGQQFDEIFVLADIAHIQKLNGWGKDSVAGFELLINDFENIDALTNEVNAITGFEFNATNIKSKNAQVFAWLEAQDINAIIIIALMIIVACVNMTTALLILILERTNMIGIIKSLGMTDWSVRKIFLYNATILIGKGIIWGNIIGLLFCFIQEKTKWLKLDPESYFLNDVPINFNINYWLLLNAGTILICLLVLIIPSFIVTKISPVKAIRFN
jgi:lipoprotein-releasing system permease protein